MCLLLPALLFLLINAQVAQAEAISDSLSTAVQAEAISGGSEPAQAEATPDSPARTESLPDDLVETEQAVIPPARLLEGVKANTPDGRAAQMTEQEREQFLRSLFYANGPEQFFEAHADVTATFSRYDEITQTWSEYCRTYTDQSLSFTDDWTPGMEELRYLVRDDACAEEYTQSIGVVCFLNCREESLRSPLEDPVMLNKATMEETLLRLEQEGEVLYAVTQLTASEAATLDLPAEEAGSFDTCTYCLDASSLQVGSIRITRHLANGSHTDLRSVQFSCDHGMPELVRQGVEALRMHLEPDRYWDSADVRTVTVTLDPGTAKARARTLRALKGDPVSVLLPEDYQLFLDETCTVPWVDNGDYTKDLVLWAAPVL